MSMSTIWMNDPSTEKLKLLIFKCVMLFYFNYNLVIFFLVNSNMFLVKGNMFCVNGNLFLVNGKPFINNSHISYGFLEYAWCIFRATYQILKHISDHKNNLLKEESKMYGQSPCTLINEFLIFP